MSTAILQKTPVEAKWDLAKVQSEAVNAMTSQMVATMATIGKLGPEVHQELIKNKVASQVEHFKKLGVKTPIDLVKAKAEFETNVFGSKIKIVGDDKKAELFYEQCACWTAMQKIGHLTEEQQKRAGQGFETMVKELAKAFGFKGELKMEGEKATITFSV